MDESLCQALKSESAREVCDGGRRQVISQILRKSSFRAMKMFRKYFLLPDIVALWGLPPDSAQLDVADVMVLVEAAFAPADDHRGLEEIRSALLQCALPSKVVTQC